jgi:hypothetical protein
MFKVDCEPARGFTACLQRLGLLERNIIASALQREPVDVAVIMSCVECVSAIERVGSAKKSVNKFRRAISRLRDSDQ